MNIEKLQKKHLKSRFLLLNTTVVVFSFICIIVAAIGLMWTNKHSIVFGSFFQDRSQAEIVNSTVIFVIVILAMLGKVVYCNLKTKKLYKQLQELQEKGE
jgi:hypothetical protein